MNFLFRFFLCSLFLQLLLSGCSIGGSDSSSKKINNEILVYSGMSVKDAVFLLAADFQSSSDCQIKVIYGASRHLTKAVELTKAGDLFISGYGYFINEIRQKNLVYESVSLGDMRLAMFVNKGNPLRFTGSLEELTQPSIKIGLGSYLLSGVGEETYRLLQFEDIAPSVLKNVNFIGIDSADLMKALINRDVDVIIDWSFVANDNTDKIEIHSEGIRDVPINACILKSSRNRKCAVKFYSLLQSKKGIEQFNKYRNETDK